MALKDSDVEKITSAIHIGTEIAFAEHLRRWRQATASDSGVRLRGAAVKPFRLTVGGATAPGQTFTAEPNRFMGFMAAETSGTAGAVLTLFDSDHGNDAGKIIGQVTLGPGESTREYWGPHGLALSEGLYVGVTGAIVGSVFTMPGA